MKVNAVGNNEDLLLWPSDAIDLTRVSTSEMSSGIHNEPASGQVFGNSDLLWPAALINQQARGRKQRDCAFPLAILAFVLSSLLGLIVGPLQLIMIAITNNYNWVTTIFYDSVLHFVLPFAGVISVLIIVILAMLWLRPTLKQLTILALVIGSLVEMQAIWIFGYYNLLPPPQLILLMVSIIVIFFLIILFVNKQYVAKPELMSLTKLIVIAFGIMAMAEIVMSGVYLFGNTGKHDDSEIAHLTALQAEARVEGVPELLSDLVFAICDNNKYQVVFLGETDNAGIFECVNSGEVYSVMEFDTTIRDTITGGATYFGTTKDKVISVAFPNTYYLYRSLPNVLSEDELAIMFPATSEQELVDNLAPMLFNYWQEHNEHNLYLNVFYNADLSQIGSTRDYILMSALGTMVMAEGLPRGLTVQSVADNAAANYLFHADTELLALNELGRLPEQYAYSTREALMNHRHIALHLVANEELDYNGLVTRLWEAFTGGLES